MENELYDRTKLPVGLENVRHGWLTQIETEWLIETRMGSLVAKFSSQEAAEEWWFQHTSPVPTKLKLRINQLNDNDRKARRKKARSSGGRVTILVIAKTPSPLMPQSRYDGLERTSLFSIG